MTHKTVCLNHPDQEARSFCFSCKNKYCFECLDEGTSHYYCRNADCQEMLKEEQKTADDSERPTCPSCRNKILPDANFCFHCGLRLTAISDKEIDDLVTVASYGTAIEAHMARTKLEDSGIEAYVTDEQAVSMFLFRDLAYGGVKIKVRPVDMIESKKILEIVSAGSVYTPPKIFAWAALSFCLFSFIFYMLMAYFKHSIH